MDGSEPKRMESVVDMSFLAPPGAVMDWRRVLLTSLADSGGLLDRLPATTAELAEQLKLDPKSIRMNLEALTAWEVVESTDGKFAAGPEFPDDRDRLLIRRHAQVLSRWAVELPDRLADPLNRKREPRSVGDVAEWLGALGIRARHWAPAVIDMCLDAFPGARTVLDVAGGHGEYAIEAASRGLDVTMIDLPAVIGSVREWPRVRESGIDLVEGDVFESEITGSFDLVLCFGFTHTQPPERVGTLFRRLAAVTSDGGGIAIKTFIRGASPETLIFAVQKLVAGNNGDTHTLEQYTQWLADAGYDPPRLVDRDAPTLLLANFGGGSDRQSVGETAN